MMKRVAFFVAVMLLAKFARPLGPAFGYEPWDAPALEAPPSEILKAATAKPAPDHADIEVLLDETRYEFDAQGRMSNTTYRVYRFLTEDGVESSAWTGGEWSPWHQERPAVRARVITPDGTAHLLDPKTIAEVPASQYSGDELSDRRALRAPLPAVKVGAVAEEEIVVRDSRPFFNQGLSGQHFLINFGPSRTLRLTLEAPKELPLRYETFALDQKPARSEIKGRVRLVFETHPPAKMTFPEPMQPPDAPGWPSVAFSTGKSWSEVAAGYATLTEPQIDQAAVQAMVREALGGETDRRKTAVKLLAKLQESIRYVAVEFGQSAIVPAKPQDTLTRRYGDCKDQAALFSAMLRAAGQPAHLALICAGSETDLVPSLPGLGWFNHVVVYMPGNPPLWIDPTAREVAFGELPAHDQGRRALVIAPGTKELVKTPRADYHLNSSGQVVDYLLSGTGQDQVNITLTSSGPLAQAQRMFYAGVGPEKAAEYWKSMAQENYHTKTLSHFEFTPVQDKDKPFVVRAEIAGARVSTVGEGRIVTTLAPSVLFDHLPPALIPQPEESAADKPNPAAEGKPDENATAPAERKTPLMLRSPHLSHLQFRVTPPPGYAAGEIPKDQSQHYGPLTISQRFQVLKDGVVEATFHMDTGPGAFTAAEVNALRQALAALGNGNVAQWQIPISFEHRAQRLLAEGRVKDSLAEYRKLLQESPDRAEHHGLYAQALLMAGFGEAARQEARRETELAPKSAPAMSSLAWVLSHDLLGRQYGPGMDWSGAADSYRKALDLEPANYYVRAAYAALLEYSPEGLRYAPQAKLEEAQRQYRQIRKDRGKRVQADDVDSAFVLLLLRMHEFAELEKVTSDLDLPAMRSFLLAAIAAQRGAAAAEQKARSMEPGADQRRALLRAAASGLDAARLYPKAKELYAAAGASGDEAARVKSMVDFYGRMRRFEDAAFAEDDPRRPVQQLCIDLLMGGMPKAQALGLFVKTATEAERLESLQIADRSFRSWRRTDPQNERSPLSNADMVSMFEITSEGNKTSGCRVSVKGAWVAPFLRCHVVLEEGVYRLLPLGDEASLGATALDRLAAGDTPGARQWLEWAWAQQQPSVGWLDPFAASPFAQLWVGSEHDRAEHIRLAAAAVLTQGPRSQQAIPILLDAQQHNPTASQALQIDRALLRAYLEVEQPEPALKIAERMLQDRAGVKELQFSRLRALQLLGRRDEALQGARDYFGKARSGSLQDIVVAGLAAELGDYELARKQFRAAANLGVSLPMPLQALAWCAVASRNVDSQARDDAFKALERVAPQREARLLATLAAIEAELGKPAEAREHLVLSADLQCGRLSGIDWYALGRLAEHYQLDDIAKGLYRKVAAAPKPQADDVFSLAQQRLKQLEK